MAPITHKQDTKHQPMGDDKDTRWKSHFKIHADGRHEHQLHVQRNDSHFPSILGSIITRDQKPQVAIAGEVNI